jgi:hypothetical protein
MAVAPSASCAQDSLPTMLTEQVFQQPSVMKFTFMIVRLPTCMYLMLEVHAIIHSSCRVGVGVLTSSKEFTFTIHNTSM